MDISVFLAQAFGLYFVIAGLALLLQPQAVRELIRTFSGSPANIMMGGFVSLLVGVPLVLIHNIWDGAPWQTLITIMAWLALLKGVVRIFMPDIVIRLSLGLGRNEALTKLLLVIMVLIGIYLTYIGFSA